MGTACLPPHQTRPSPCAMGRNLATNLDQTARVLVPAPRELLPTGHARSRRGAPTQGSATPDAVAPAHAVTPWVVSDPRCGRPAPAAPATPGHTWMWRERCQRVRVGSVQRVPHLERRL